MQLTSAAQRLDLTYRKADYWATRGFIHATYEDKHGEPMDSTFAGTGHLRVISVEEFRVLTLMSHLVNGGVMPEQASTYARQIIAGKSVRLGPLVLSERSAQ